MKLLYNLVNIVIVATATALPVWLLWGVNFVIALMAGAVGFYFSLDVAAFIERSYNRWNLHRQARQLFGRRYR